MGSNSWRLVVFGYEPQTPWWSLVDEIREAVRIGAGMGEEGVLRPDRVDRALHTAAVFSAFCSTLPTKCRNDLKCRYPNDACHFPLPRL